MEPGKIWGGLIILFLAGTLTGIGGTILYQRYEQGHQWERGPAAKQERMMKLLTRELSLSPAQQADVEPIVSRAHVEILQLRLSHQPELEQTLARGVADLKAKLSVEQQAKLDKLYARLQRRWQVSGEYLEAARKKANGRE